MIYYTCPKFTLQPPVNESNFQGIVISSLTTSSLFFEKTMTSNENVANDNETRDISWLDDMDITKGVGYQLFNWSAFF